MEQVNFLKHFVGKCVKISYFVIFFLISPRSSAVFGGVYVLRRSPDMILLENNSVIGVKDSNGNTLSSRSVVMDPRFAGDRVRTSTSHSLVCPSFINFKK